MLQISIIRLNRDVSQSSMERGQPLKYRRYNIEMRLRASQLVFTNSQPSCSRSSAIYRRAAAIFQTLIRHDRRWLRHVAVRRHDIELIRLHTHDITHWADTFSLLMFQIIDIDIGQITHYIIAFHYWLADSHRYKYITLSAVIREEIRFPIIFASFRYFRITLCWCWSAAISPLPPLFAAASQITLLPAGQPDDAAISF